MAWDSIHRVVGGNGQVTMTPGYLSETITLGNDADKSTSHIPVPVKSDFTILAVFANDLGAGGDADTYIQVEHSINGADWIKQGKFESGGVVTSDISDDMAKIALLDDGLLAEDDGAMMMYAVETHGMSPYTRFTVKANGADESGNSCTFYIIPHY